MTTRIAGERVAIGYLLVTGIGTLLYWLDFFLAGSVRVRDDPVYLAFERAFPLADAWMAACALASAAMTFELLINVVLLAGAPSLIAFLWRRREALLGAGVR